MHYKKKKKYGAYFFGEWQDKEEATPTISLQRRNNATRTKYVIPPELTNPKNSETENWLVGACKHGVFPRECFAFLQKKSCTLKAYDFM